MKKDECIRFITKLILELKNWYQLKIDFGWDINSSPVLSWILKKSLNYTSAYCKSFRPHQDKIKSLLQLVIGYSCLACSQKVVQI